MEEHIAPNKTMHHTAEIKENIAGGLYVVSIPHWKPQLTKQSYLPLGNRLVYPKKWGAKRAAKLLLEFNIADKERVMRLTLERLEKLKECLIEVEYWSDK